MSGLYFSVASPNQAIFNSNLILGITPDPVVIYNGYLAGMNARGELAISAGSAPIGIFYDQMLLVDMPASGDLYRYLAGAKCNIVTGKFLALVGKDLFAAGTIPNAGTKLYDAGGGKYSTDPGTSNPYIGKVLMANAGSVQSPSGSSDLALVLFEFPA